MKRSSTQSGFTLVEMLIYIGIAGLIGVAMIQLTLTLTKTGSKSYTIQAVNSNARVAMQLIQDSIRNAESVVVASSTLAADPGVLWLTTTDVATNPTVISLDGDDGRLQVSYGVSENIFITSADVRVTDLQFALQQNGSRDALQIGMTVESLQSDSVEYFFATTVTSTATTRN